MKDVLDNAKVSVVIPTLNAKAYLPVLVPALRSQLPCPPAEILIVDSGSKDGTMEYVAGLGADVRLISVDRFSHGRARNLGVQSARGEYVVFMSQDAVPRNNSWLAEILAPFSNPDVAAAFSRQVPRPEANPMESFFLQTHFPPGNPTFMRRNGHKDLLFQRDVFFSNVSSAIRKDILLRHPFDETLIMSEDQQFARDAILAGYTVAYAPASVVVHSHNYSFLQALRRYFDSAHSLTKIFPKHNLPYSVRLGMGYLRSEAAMMLRGHRRMLPKYVGYVAAKSIGTLLGHHAEGLPRSVVIHLTLHRDHWAERGGGRS